MNSPEPLATETEDLLLKLAQKIAQLRLQAPALFFLESQRPFTTIAHTGALLFEPFAAPIVGLGRVRSLQRLLEDRTNIDRLIQLIEESDSGAVEVAHGTR